MSSAPNRPPRRAAGGGEKLARWAAAALWFGVILSLSRESFASSHTEGWLAQLLAGWGLDLGPLVGRLNWIVRKSAHFVEYAVLGWLVYRAWESTCPHRDPVGAAIATVFLGAGLDELGQAMSVSRTGSFEDVLVDGLGGGIGALLAAWGWAALRLRRGPPRAPLRRG